MSRVKNKSPKKLEGKSVKEKHRITQVGAAYNDETKPYFSEVSHWSAIFSTFQSIEIYRKKGFKDRSRWNNEKEFWADLETQKDMLLTRLMDAIDRQDASYFKKLSIAIENYWPNKPVDPVRHFLVSVLFDWQTGEQAHFLTLHQLVNTFKLKGIIVDPDQLRRTCKEVGVKLKPVPIGRPRKSDNNKNSKS